MKLEWEASYELCVEVRRSGTPRRRYGVPPGGPCDEESYDRATRAVGACHAFELFGLATQLITFRGEGNFVCCGAPRRIYIDGAPGRMDVVYPARAGSSITLEPGNPGAVTTVAFGPESVVTEPILDTTEVIRVWAGVDQLDDSEFFDTEFAASIHSNRVGIRLTPAILGAKDLPHSEPVCPGVIQLPPSGGPIILGPDGPTIGGYQRLGTVHHEDLGKIYRRGFGKTLKFQKIT